MIHNKKNEIVISVNDYCKNFKNFQIGIINFSVRKGTIHALVGQSGSGKSVLLRSIIGGVVPSSYQGKITINGYKVGSANSKVKLGLSINLEKFPLGITAYKFLWHLGRTVNISKLQLRTNIETLMRKFNLWEHRTKSLNSFSSGMKNRIMIIISLLNTPDLIILDEPGANLDSESRTFFYSVLKQLKAEGKTILLTSHMIDELKDIIDDFTLIEKGKMLYTGSKKQLKINNHYVLNTDNNDTAINLLTQKKFIFEQIDDNILIEITRENNKKTLNNLLKVNNITINKFYEKEIDLLFLKSLIGNIALQQAEQKHDKATEALQQLITETTKPAQKQEQEVVKAISKVDKNSSANNLEDNQKTVEQKHDAANNALKQLITETTKPIKQAEQKNGKEVANVSIDLITKTEQEEKVVTISPNIEGEIPDSVNINSANKTNEIITWTTKQIDLVWNKAIIIPGFNPNLYRKDYAGALMFRNSFVNQPPAANNFNPKHYSWTINLHTPSNYGGTTDIDNLKPLNVINAFNKADNFPNWKTSITFNGAENIIKEKLWKI